MGDLNNVTFGTKIILKIVIFLMGFWFFLLSVSANEQYYTDSCGEFAEYMFNNNVAKEIKIENKLFLNGYNSNNLKEVINGHTNINYVGKDNEKVFFTFNHKLYYAEYNGLGFNLNNNSYLKLFNNNINNNKVLSVNNGFIYYEFNNSIFKIRTNCNNPDLKGSELLKQANQYNYLDMGKYFIYLGDNNGNLYKLGKKYNWYGHGNEVNLIGSYNNLLFVENQNNNFEIKDIIYFTDNGKTYKSEIKHSQNGILIEIYPYEINNYINNDNENIYYSEYNNIFYIKKNGNNISNNIKYNIGVDSYITNYGGFDYYIVNEINEVGGGNQVYKVSNNGNIKLTDEEGLFPMFSDGKYFYFNSKKFTGGGLINKVYRINLEGTVSGGGSGNGNGGNPGGGTITNPDTGETQNNTNNTQNSIEANQKVRDYLYNKYIKESNPVTDSTQGDPVLLHSGEFLYNNIVMSHVGKNLDFKFDITYKNQSNYNGPLGYNFDFGYNKYIQVLENGDIKYFDGELGVSIFEYDEENEEYLYNKKTKSQLFFDGEYYYIAINNELFYYFGDNNKLSEISDNYGNYILFEYDETNKLVKIIDTLENEYELIYRDDTRLDYIVDFNGNEVFFDYFENENNSAKLKSITLINYPEEKTIFFDYDENKNINKLIDFDGNIYVENIYDGQKRVINQKFGEGNITYDYTLSEDETYILKNEVITRVGDKVIYTYNSGGQILKKEIFKNSGDSYEYNYEYDENNNVIKEIFPLGNGYNYSYDENFNLIEKRFKQNINSENSEDDIVFYYEYDLLFNKKTKEIFPNLAKINYTLNHLGNVVSKQIIAGDIEIIETFEYNEFGEINKKIDSNGNITNYEYDGANLSKIIKIGDVYNIIILFEYDSKGNITKITDGEGNEINLSYSDFNLLTKQTNPSGIETSFEYNSLNKKTKEYIILGEDEQKETVFEYDILDNPTKVTANIDSIKDKTIVTKYDADNRIIETQNGSNAKNTFQYDENGNINQKTTVLNNGEEITTYYFYDENNNLYRQINPNGNEIFFDYDGFNRLIEVIKPDFIYTTYTYDNMGNIVETKNYDNDDNLVSKTGFEYDLLSRKTKQINYLLEENKQIITSFVYDNNGNLTSQTNALNQTTNFEYDSFDRVIKTIDNLGNILEYIYDKNDNIIQENIIGYDGKTISKFNQYDSDNRLVSQTDNIGNTISFEYNNLNQVITKIDGKGIETYYEYDYIGNILSEARGDRQINYEYDVYANMTKIIDANGNETIYEYDELNRLVKHIYPDNTFTTYQYDVNSNVLQKVDGNGTIINYSYDSQNRLIEKNITNGIGVIGVTQENFFYDSLGRLIKTTNNEGTQTLFTYDSLNRLTSETQKILDNEDFTKTINYTYDFLGNRTSIGLDGKTTSYNYDSNSRLESILRENSELVRYNYDSLNLISKTYDNGKITTYNFDELNRLSSLDNSIKNYNYSYDENNNIVSNGFETYYYDNLNQIEGVMYSERFQNKDLVGYSYDQMGNRTGEFLGRVNKRGNTNIFREFGYSTNELNQYLDRYIVDNSSTPVGLDDGNIIDSDSGIIGNGIIGDVEYTDNSQDEEELVELNGKLIYDKNGNMIGNMLNNKRQYIYSYDYKNRLVKVEKTVYKNIEGTETNEVQEIVKIIQYKYDNLDRRIQKIFNNGSIINYYYSNKDIILEENYTKVNNNGNRRLKTSKYYINGNSIDDVLAMEKVDYKNRKVQETYVNNRGVTKTRTINETYTETNTYFYHKNHLNSIVAITDNLGNILEEYEYDVFGKPYSKDIVTGKITNLKKSVIGNTRLFTGREYERGLQLYYNRARYYNPELGRFISRDPIDIADDVNLYAYVGNSPISFTDPMGLAKVLIIGGAEGYIGQFKHTIEYYENLFLEQGVKEKNIIIIENVTSSQNFNEAVKPYVGNIQEIVHINHGSNLETWNIGELNAINNNSCSNVKMTIIACNAGKGENSIGEQMSNQLGISTEAASGYVYLVGNMENNPLVNTIDYFSGKKGEPLIFFGLGKWNTFTPNY